MLNRIKKNILLKACLANNDNLFTEIRRQRKCNRVYANIIDGHNNGIPSHFAKMYNCVDDEDNLSRIEGSIEGKITQRSNSDICQITTELLKSASQKLKSGKSDPLLNVTSDFFLNAPPILYDMRTAILRGYITRSRSCK